jgi:hypothetical protein
VWGVTPYILHPTPHTLRLGRVAFASAEVWQTLAYPFYTDGYTLNPQPSTLHLQPLTSNPNLQPSTLNPQPKTLNPKPEIPTLNPHS